MGRTVTLALLAAGAIPWLYLLLVQIIALVVVIVVAGDLGTCLDTGALPSVAMFWLAIAPLPLGLSAPVAGVRRGRTPRAGAIGLGLLGIGFPLCVLASGQVACPGRVLPFDDADEGNVPVEGWTLAAYLLVLVCFGAVLLAGTRRA